MEASSQLAFNDDIKFWSRPTYAGWLLKQGQLEPQSVSPCARMCVNFACICVCVCGLV